MTEAVTELLEKISLQGNKVRQLKADGAEKSVIDAEVKQLLALKAQLPQDSKKSEKKKEKKVDERAAKKEARRLARMNKGNEPAPIVDDINSADFGELRLIQSRKEDKLGRKFVEIKKITAENAVAHDNVWVRAYVHTVRSQSKLSFLVLRQQTVTIQGVVSEKKASKFVSNHVTSESVVDVFCDVVTVEKPTKASKSNVELQIKKIFVVSKATSQLPFQVIDASRSEKEIKELEAQADDDTKVVRVGLDTRLDNRTLDLRTPLSQSILKVTSQVLSAFRNHLSEKGFIEICSPKLLGGASEGGAEVFMTDYFGKEAFLAQSPQLHKQMSACCSGLGKVFEVGPVFRAENSNTNRHLCEFTGLDVEMCFNEHYHEVLDMFSDLFHHVFTCVNTKTRHEVDVIKSYFPVEDLVFEAPDWIESSKIAGVNSRTLRLEFKEAIAMLREAGVGEEEQPSFDDLSTASEKKLGGLVKEKFGVDFYFLDKFPYAPRPFYTMPCPEDPRLSNSYDFFIRGQEIMSGAQRVHDAELLREKVKEKGVPVESLSFYIDAFKQGAPPHGGGGVGLERVVMLFLGLPNIRLVRMFPRDPQRLMP